MPPPLRLAMWVAGAALISIAVTRWLTWTIDRNRVGRSRRWPLLAASGLAAALTWLAVAAWRDTGLDASSSGYASIVLALLGFAGLLAAGALGMLIAAQLWAWLRPEDPRGRGVALNTSLVCYASGGTWLLVLGVVYLWPRAVG